jgi:amidohydrolase
LHENPELSFNEYKTAQYIADFYRGKEVEIQTNVGNGLGIIITIKGGKPGKSIGIRADFDAVAVDEEVNLQFKSKNSGVMHACGHDGHTAYLLILADCFIQLKADIPGTIKIIHQHGEEVPPGGAKSIIESGLLDDLDAIFGIHLFPTHPAGVVGYRIGYAMAGRQYFKLAIQGIGGHGSTPHMANDAIVAGAYFVTAVQTVISRRLNPFEMGVVTVGSFDGKGLFNAIKDRVVLEGDIRFMNVSTRELIDEELQRIVKGIEAEFGVHCEFVYGDECPPVYNDPKLSESVKTSLNAIIDPDIKQVTEFPMFSGSEDFAFYTQRIPGCFFFIGCQPKGVEKAYFNHSPRFEIDEDSLVVAAKAVAQVVCSYFNLE